MARGESCLYVYAALKHQPGYPAFGVGEARYCLKLNPDVFDYLSVDADRQRLMPRGYDWDRGAPLNVKEARRMTTGVHKGEAEHKYDYSAVLSETPAYGWSSTRDKVGLWLINPSIEYLGGGPTKAELTGHLDVNPGGLPTLLNMWVGSHYGGTTISVATNEAWTKVVGPFALYCNSSLTLARSDTNAQRTLWQDALVQAARETGQWPYAWVSDPDYPPSAERASVSGELVLRDPFAPGATMSNIWVGLAAPDYEPSRLGLGFGAKRLATNSPASGLPYTNASGRWPAYVYGRAGLPPYVDWQRDAKFYQFWTRADAQGRFVIRHVRAGTYTLHAIADGMLGEFALTNVTVTAGDNRSLGQLVWTPLRFGRTLWEIGFPDRTAREFRHGDHYWQWGLYFDYPKEFPKNVNFVIGRSDWRRDWNYVQPPRIETRNVPAVGEDEEQNEAANQPRAPFEPGDVRSTTWSIKFDLREPAHGTATLRLAFCGTHVGCHVEAFANGKPIGDTGLLPSTSAMQRDGIRAYWVEKDLSFDANLLTRGTNVIKLLSHANSWSQGIMYDCVRLELNHTEPEH
ncbi:MAG TPA: polysaccharide lyase family protein [Candidatus Acidoferrum sp.]|nr:polysaccharide lyase family protein [Candidatus Acidoferrum sp.]